MASSFPNAPEASHDVRSQVHVLEGHMETIRDCGSILLGFDAWDRWGSARASPEERAEKEAEIEKVIRRRTQAIEALGALVTKLRAELPAAVQAWAEAHDQELAEFIAECAQKTDDQDARIGESIAAEERVAWADVRAGGRAHVEENNYYVRPNKERHATRFGV